MYPTQYPYLFQRAKYQLRYYNSIGDIDIQNFNFIRQNCVLSHLWPLQLKFRTSGKFESVIFRFYTKSSFNVLNINCNTTIAQEILTFKISILYAKTAFYHCLWPLQLKFCISGKFVTVIFRLYSKSSFNVPNINCNTTIALEILTFEI